MNVATRIWRVMRKGKDKELGYIWDRKVFQCKKALIFDDELKECPKELLELHHLQLYIEELGRYIYHDPDDTEPGWSWKIEMYEHMNQMKKDYTDDTLFYQTK